MIPQIQEFLHDPENGVMGDCFRAVIASLMELPMEEVPHFHEGVEINDHISFWKAVNTFLYQHKKVFCNFPSNSFKFSDIWPDLLIYHEISDRSPRFPDQFHSVVGCNGVMVHDPHPSCAGLLHTEERTFGFILCTST